MTNETHVVYNWPEVMFSELATNCILHKEYERENYVGIYWYSDHLTFVNHNRPFPPVTIQDLNDKTEFDDRRYLNKELKEMFFALNLIQSYGSGIRRAKKAMADNHSPKLVFEPTGEDEKDFTMVTAYINKEFVRIRKEENRKDGSTTQKTTQKTTPKTRDIILDLMRKKPQISQEEIAAETGISINGVKYHIKKLRSEEIIGREGGRKEGRWIVNHD